MIRFAEDYSLKNHNTFGIDVKARYFFEFTEMEDLDIFLRSNKSWTEEKILFLGEGSNLLFLGDFEGLVIHPNIPGMEVIREDQNHVWVEAGSGEVWDDFVQFCVDRGYGGVENLAFIPGTIGAAPVQNIGAYGQELSSVVEAVKGFDFEHKEFVEYSGRACKFSYRNSIFKNDLKDRFIILSVIFKLDKFPKYNLDYQKLGEKVSELGEVNLETIKNAVTEIRAAKLPDVGELGSAGSFFKNPEVSQKKAKEIEREYPGMPHFKGEGDKIKLAAGWLIEKCGWKGYSENGVGVHDKQALVLVNFGGASGMDIYNLSEKIKVSVKEKFGIELEREVNCI